ncbi:expressed unknown protein [Seminavis robusta]|uniref:Plastid lipid-associated protein/fibrillin conserved domain-containing protein n=1 Tax=Seminavis robusta TaxID=568900 RepID=A0A9N8EEX3_9STRA|nr:expressed unknown protein [Seminavis robusta]|eukprot:Sro900_g217900.1 n/a (277) ;mRNA; r:39239-40069
MTALRLDLFKTLVSLFLIFATICHGFSSSPSFRPVRSSSRLQLFDLKSIFSSSDTDKTTASSSVTEVDSLKGQVEELIIVTQGKAAAIHLLDPIFEQIESQNTVEAPNRDPNFKGRWHVWFTDCPPPSNGQLGPFQGSAEQDIVAQGNEYNNILRLPSNSRDDQWLTVVLDGIWEDWDGKELSDGDDSDSSTGGSFSTPLEGTDWGAKYWKVTFLRLNFSLFGNLLLSKDFPAGVARVWRSTYLDDDTKIVRASRTGRPDDESVFYMKRSVRPNKN